MKRFKYMQLSEWKKREFAGKAWQNRTIRKYISEGRLIGILNARDTLVREDQTLEHLNEMNSMVADLIKESA